MTTRTPDQYDFSRLEFNQRWLRKHYTPLVSRKVKGFTVHHMTIVGTGNGAANDKCYDVWQNRQASAHYCVDGIYVTQCVRDKDYAWATGSSKGNLDTISVEHANSSAGPKWLVDNATILTGAKLIANGHVFFKLGRPVVGKTLFEHDDWFATACPGPFLGGTQWAMYVKTVQRFYDELTGTKPVEPPKPVVRVAKWGEPDTWVLGAVGPDVTRLGERIRVWSKALDLPDPYKVGPGEPYGPADVNGLQDLQVAWGFGSSPADLKLGGASDGYPGPQSFAKLASTPPAKPVTPPKAKTMDIKVMFLPMAGYNADSAPGVKKWKSNTDGLAALVKKYDPDLFGTTELSNRDINPMLPRFESKLPEYDRTGGSDGRYGFRRKATTNHIAGGAIEAPKSSLLNGDTKQAAWSLDKVGPNDELRVGTIYGHTENQDGVDKKTRKNADNLRVEQMDSFISQGLAKIKAAGGADVVMVLADTNSENMVRDHLENKGWKSFGGGYFTRWDDSAKKRFDWGFVKVGKVSSKRIDHDFADHTAIVITWTVPVPA